ncbi:MAG: MoxR family ATPase [Wenzhouxiangellaceae bacterium]
MPNTDTLGSLAAGPSNQTRVPLPTGIDTTLQLFERGGYIADRELATAVYLALTLQRPLFLEGEPGVGKTELARTLATCLQRELIRLQCYEGLDLASAAYEWNYQQQMIEIRLAEAAGETNRERLHQHLFSERFLIRRPLLRALEASDHGPPVLLIDELDRADEAFEAYLLEFLGDYAMSIPELGTLRASEPPLVIITSNRTREVHDALKRRCFYFWVDHPGPARERLILQSRVPDAERVLVDQVVNFVGALRAQALFKKPSVAEAIDWLRALVGLGVSQLSPEVVGDTLGVLLKYQEDLQALRQPAQATADTALIAAILGAGTPAKT